MNGCLIHIGYHKTGTTWLQKYVFNRSGTDFASLSNREDECSSLAWHFIRTPEEQILSPFNLYERVITGELECILKEIDITGRMVEVRCR